MAERKVALVTGGARGIGRACAHALADRGFDIVLVDLLRPEMERTAEELRRMGRDDITVHGFRSTFRDWAAERTNFPSEVVEMALAHVVGDKVEAAYRRGDLFEKRRRLMVEWETFCNAPTQKTARDPVVPLQSRRQS